MAEDTATTDDGCGCCRPEPKSSEDVVRDLLDRRARIEERLTRLDLAGLRGPNAMVGTPR